MKDGRCEALLVLTAALRAYAAKKSYWVERRRRRKAIRKAYAQHKREKLKASCRAGRDLVVAAKKNPCTDCGLLVPGHMSFDHLPGHVKKFDIGHSMRRKLNQIRRELAKCELVCCLCHDRRERARGSKSGHTCRAWVGICPLYEARKAAKAAKRAAQQPKS